ncbi:SIMPL domain-containing protein [Spirillospora sp. NPDC047279]|uniref:SIMPL domain-containing protein n=1 Tax=Spirillospora sp. NPDC047279 TaxID=3155478 RepID=UPI00340553CD
MLNDPKITEPWGVATFGAATVSAEPDFVRVQLQLECDREQPAEAFEGAHEIIAAFRAVLRAREIPEGGVSSSQLKLSTRYEYSRVEDRRKKVGYACEADFEIETVAIDDLQGLLTDVVSAGVDQIKGIVFDVRAKPALRARARRDAVAAARAKAELYAEAAGVKLGRVVHIEDVDPERMKTYSHGTARGGVEEDLAPGLIAVTAAVAMGFSIEG